MRSCLGLKQIRQSIQFDSDPLEDFARCRSAGYRVRERFRVRVTARSPEKALQGFLASVQIIERLHHRIETMKSPGSISPSVRHRVLVVHPQVHPGF
jgi:hypothetical protein